MAERLSIKDSIQEWVDKINDVLDLQNVDGAFVNQDTSWADTNFTLSGGKVRSGTSIIDVPGATKTLPFSKTSVVGVDVKNEVLVNHVEGNVPPSGFVPLYIIDTNNVRIISVEDARTWAYEDSGAAADAVSAHEGKADPHSQYALMDELSFDYAAGIEIESHAQIIKDDSGIFWRAASTTTLPYTTDGTGLPEGGAFVSAGDAVLRNDLMNSLANGQGALNVRGSVIYVDTISDLQALPTSGLVDGQSGEITTSGDDAGILVWRAGDQSSNTGRYGWVFPDDDPSGSGGAWQRLVDNLQLQSNILPLPVLGLKLGVPITDAGAIINAAWSAGYGVEIPPGAEYTVSTDILLRKDAVLVGSGNKVSGLKAASNFQGNVIDTQNFDTLQTNQDVASANGVPTGFVLRGFYIKGNKDTFPVAVSSGIGFGIRIYGKQFIVEDVRIHGAAHIGFYSELSTTGSIPGFNPFDDAKPGYIDKLFVYDSGYEGFYFVGPTDIKVNHVFVGWPANSLNDTAYDNTKESLLRVGETIDGMVFIRGCELGFIHSFDNTHGWGVSFPSDPSVVSRVTGDYIMSERNFGQVFIGDNVRWLVSNLMIEENIGGDGTRPHIRDESTSGGQCQNAQIFRGGNELGSTCIEVAGQTANWKGKVISNSIRAGHCIDLIGTNNRVEFDVINAQGATQAGQVSSGLVWRDGAVRNVVNVKAQACDRNFNFQGTGTIDYRSSGQLVSTFPNLDSFFSVDDLSASQYKRFDMSNDTGSGDVQENQFIGDAVVDFTVTGAQTVTIPHDLLRVPENWEVTASLAYESGTAPDVERLIVSGTDGTNISVLIDITTGTSGQGRVVVRV